jgi:hypothetical protein
MEYGDKFGFWKAAFRLQFLLRAFRTAAFSFAAAGFACRIFALGASAPQALSFCRTFSAKAKTRLR